MRVGGLEVEELLTGQPNCDVCLQDPHHNRDKSALFGALALPEICLFACAVGVRGVLSYRGHLIYSG